MSGRIRQKWRPPLTVVIGGSVVAVLVVPLLGIGYFRVAGNVLGWAETTWLIFWMALIASGILAYLLWRLVLRPVWALTGYAHAVRDGGQAELPPHFGTPEITDLARAVRDMQSALEDREAGLRAYTDHVTHELKTPLTALIGAAELLDGDLPETDRRALVQTVAGSARQMEAQLNALRAFAAAKDPVGRGPVRLSDVAAGITVPGLVVEVADDGMVPLSHAALEAVLVQLAQNAAAHGADRLELSLIGAGLRITDNGTGIAEGNKGRVFDPFFTTRRATGGTGMGLAIVRRMLGAAGAEIDYAPAHGRGARFLIRF